MDHVWDDEPKVVPMKPGAVPVTELVTEPLVVTKPKKGGRPPKYASLAEKQAAYRKRKQEKADG